MLQRVADTQALAASCARAARAQGPRALKPAMYSYGRPSLLLTQVAMSWHRLLTCFARRFYSKTLNANSTLISLQPVSAILGKNFKRYKHASGQAARHPFQGELGPRLEAGGLFFWEGAALGLAQFI